MSKSKNNHPDYPDCDKCKGHGAYDMPCDDGYPDLVVCSSCGGSGKIYPETVLEDAWRIAQETRNFWDTK